MALNAGDVFTDSLDGLGNPYTTRTQTSLAQLASRARSAVQRAGEQTITPRPLMHPRDAMTITCRSWRRQGRYIEFFVNPLTMNWTLPRRGTIVKTMGGTVMNMWRNRYRNRYFDEGTVAITFQTGNIMPSMGYDNSELRTAEDVAAAISDPRTPPGLQDFYSFIELLNEPILLGAAPNYHTIVHHSRVFPNLTLTGFFQPDTFSFSESATDGNKLQWEATFQWYYTSPTLWNSSDMRSTYNNFIQMRNLLEQFGAENMQLAQHPGTNSASRQAGATRGSNPNRVKTVLTSSAKRNNVADGARLAVQAGQTASGFVASI